LDCSDKGVELVVLDLDAAAEGRVEAADVSIADDAPPDGVQKGIKARGVVEAARRRKLVTLEGSGTKLRLPHNLKFLAQGAILD
jgi:hypothetical protein